MYNFNFTQTEKYPCTYTDNKQTFICSISTKRINNKDGKFSYNKDGVSKTSSIWSSLKYKDTKTDLNTFIYNISLGSAFCHIYKHNNIEFGNKEKQENNFICSQIIYFDIDDVDVTYNDFCNYIEETEINPTLIYTTQNDGIKGNRYRVIYVLSAPINRDSYRALYQYIFSEIQMYFPTIKKDVHCDHLHQPFAGNATPNFKYHKGDIFEISFFADRYNFNIVEVTEGQIKKIQKSATFSIIEEQKQNAKQSNDESATLNNIIHETDTNEKYTLTERYIYNSILEKINKLTVCESATLTNIIKKRKENIITQYCTFIETPFIKDYFKEDNFVLLDKYRGCYENVESTKLNYNEKEMVCYLPNDYTEIKRKYHVIEKRINGQIKKISVCDRITKGSREKTLFNNLCLRLKINPSLTFDNLLYNALYELCTFIDNTDKDDVITKTDLVSITIDAYFNTKYNFKSLEKRKYKINKTYCANNGINPQMAALIYENQKKKTEKEKRDVRIKQLYDITKTDKQNLQILNESGIDIKLRTLKTWKAENGIKKYKKSDKKESTTKKANISTQSAQNEKMDISPTEIQKSAQSEIIAVTEQPICTDSYQHNEVTEQPICTDNYLYIGTSSGNANISAQSAQNEKMDKSPTEIQKSEQSKKEKAQSENEQININYLINDIKVRIKEHRISKIDYWFKFTFEDGNTQTKTKRFNELLKYINENARTNEIQMLIEKLTEQYKKYA